MSNLVFVPSDPALYERLKGQISAPTDLDLRETDRSTATVTFHSAFLSGLSPVLASCDLTSGRMTLAGIPHGTILNLKRILYEGQVFVRSDLEIVLLNLVVELLEVKGHVARSFVIGEADQRLLRVAAEQLMACLNRSQANVEDQDQEISEGGTPSANLEEAMEEGSDDGLEIVEPPPKNHEVIDVASPFASPVSSPATSMASSGSGIASPCG